MRLAQKASGLLKGLRAKQTGEKRANGQEKYKAVFIEKGWVAELKSKKKAKEQARSRYPRRAADKVIATATGERRRTMAHAAIAIHEDVPEASQPLRTLRRMSAHRRPQPAHDDESDQDEAASDDTDSEDEPDESVMEDMRKLEENFEGISQKYRLINRIGEGTFSTVYKAEQLFQDDNEDDSNLENEPADAISRDAPPSKRRKLTTPSQITQRVPRRRHQFVALKKIYVTSSPTRILNELELLHELRHSDYICPLLTAFRHLDQVVAVLPYFKHLDFRLFYRDFIVNDMRTYFKSLFNGLAVVHKAGILHRDIKPTNFLYDHSRRHGVLVDFGLAERQGTDWQPCLCMDSREKRKDRFLNSFAVKVLENTPQGCSTGHPKNDTRPSRRANRAGTRGFRAPEVLFKCTSQTTKIDMWSAGVILLTLLARRFPFFNSADDVDAMIEMASVFGKKKMKAVAALHGQLFETNIETIGVNGFSMEKIIAWAASKDHVGVGEQQAIRFLEGLLELDPSKRFSAKEALQHEFFTSPVEDEDERNEREAHEAEEIEARRRY